MGDAVFWVGVEKNDLGQVSVQIREVLKLFESTFVSNTGKWTNTYLHRATVFRLGRISEQLVRDMESIRIQLLDDRSCRLVN